MAVKYTEDIGQSNFILQVGWVQIFFAISCCYTLHFATKFVRRKLREREMKRKIKNRKLVLTSNRRRLKMSLNDDEDAKLRKDVIARKSVHQLLSELRDGTLSAVLVLHCYQLKALEEDEKYNCVTDFIEEAEKWAENLDKSPVAKGPLHGLPISIKENIHIKGYDCTIGLVQYLDTPMDHDANIVKVLKDAGAVPFVKTNVPQTLMAYHCSNPVYGVTLHPLNPSRTPGGSSGGEAALISAGGSPLGIGTDIGGSGRIPAVFCGIYSLKPTANRLTLKTTRESLEGVAGLYPSHTPMARDVETLVLFMRTVLTDKMFSMDPEVVPLPFNELMFSSRQRLKIGFYTDDGFITPTPGCQRAVMIARNLLESAGHKLIPFTIPEPWTAYRLIIKLIMADGSETFKRIWDKDITDERLLLNYRITNLPATCKKFLGAISRGVTPRGALCIGETGCSGLDLWKLVTARKHYLSLFLSTWKESQLDILLAPGFAFPAPPHKYPEKLLPNTFITVLYNFLNFPSGVVPVTAETEQDQMDLDTYRQDDLVFRLAKQATRGAINMPLGVQIVGLPWQEEMVLRIMGELEGLIKFPVG